MILPIIASRRKRVVVDVDTQTHFFTPGGVVCVQNHRQVLARILKIINWAKLSRVRMISTVQTLIDQLPFCESCACSFEGQTKIRYTFCKRRASFDATDCTDFPIGLFDRYDQVVLCKRCFDPFQEPRADRMLSELEADEFVLVGAVTEGAIKATALGLLSRQKNVTILSDAVGSYNEAVGHTALRLMTERGAHLTDTQTFLGSCCLELVASCGHDRPAAKLPVAQS
jgi:nicotinamidase-related amidase